jgi:hypothetical protein
VRNKRRILSGTLLSAAASLFSIFFFILVHKTDAAENRFEPSMLVREEYNDNIFLTPQNREYDYITSIIPGVRFSYNTAFWNWDVSYSYNYRYFALTPPHHSSGADSQYASITNQTRVLEDFFFLELHDNYQNVSLDVTKDYTSQSYFVNQTEQNIGVVNPYIVLHPSARTKINIGYIYENIWYRDPNAINKVNNSGYTEMGHELTSKLSTTIGLRYTDDKNKVQNFNSAKAYIGMNYQYIEGSHIYGSIGYISANLENEGKVNQPTWDAGYDHKFPKFSFSFETGLNYIEDPTRVLRRQDRYIATISRVVERTAYSIYAGFYEYRNAVTKNLEDSSYNVGGKLTHKITTNSTILLDLSYQRIEDNTNDTYTEIYLNLGRYEYLLLENLTLALEYRYTNSYSPDIYANDYYNNRISAEVKWAF